MTKVAVHLFFATSLVFAPLHAQSNPSIAPPSGEPYYGPSHVNQSQGPSYVDSYHGPSQVDSYHGPSQVDSYHGPSYGDPYHGPQCGQCSDHYHGPSCGNPCFGQPCGESFIPSPCSGQPIIMDQPPETWLQRSGLPIFGGLLLGAAAGALSGYLVCNNSNNCNTCNNGNGNVIHGDRGKCGRHGRDGKDGKHGKAFTFPRDREDHHTLLIDYTVFLSKPTTFSGVIAVTPFVTLPDQSTIEGATKTFDFAAELTIDCLHEIVICKPFFGNYQIGVRVANGCVDLIDLNNVTVDLYATVTASRKGGSVTSLHNLNEAPSGVPANRDQSQTAVSFTYDDARIWDTIP